MRVFFMQILRLCSIFNIIMNLTSYIVRVWKFFDQDQIQNFWFLSIENSIYIEIIRYRITSYDHTFKWMYDQITINIKFK